MSPTIAAARAWLLATLLTAAAVAVPPATARAALGDRPLHRGSHGHDVRVLQSWLTRLGLRTHVDGRYGRGTARHVRRFERRHGRRIDGRMSRADARALRALIEGATATRPAVRTAVATLTPDGRTAVAPPDAPAPVQAAIAAANRITDKPYSWGGGHGRWEDSGYDCSGAVSYVLHGAGLLAEALDSSALARWGDPGVGPWITVYGRADHAFVVIAGLRFDTSGAGEDGPRWRPEPRSGARYAARHPSGL
jgi:peptidoglycan hydrolase-like protein with peptidoglycan-binding domain